MHGTIGLDDFFNMKARDIADEAKCDSVTGLLWTNTYKYEEQYRSTSCFEKVDGLPT